MRKKCSNHYSFRNDKHKMREERKFGGGLYCVNLRDRVGLYWVIILKWIEYMWKSLFLIRMWNNNVYLYHFFLSGIFSDFITNIKIHLKRIDNSNYLCSCCPHGEMRRNIQITGQFVPVSSTNKNLGIYIISFGTLTSCYLALCCIFRWKLIVTLTHTHRSQANVPLPLLSQFPTFHNSISTTIHAN